MSYIGRTKTPAPLTSADIPDGIVAAADLAPNSVDSSELVDGSIDTSHLSSSLTLTTPNLGTVATGDLSNTAIVYPTGHIIKMIKGENTTSSGTQSSDDGAAFGTTVTITSPISGSKIICWAIGGMVYSTLNGASFKTRCGLDFTQSGASGSPNTYWSGGTEGHSNDDASYTAHVGSALAEYTSDGTNDIVIQLRCGRYDTYPGSWTANANTPVIIVAMEVKQ